jgi:hypothetical protein
MCLDKRIPERGGLYNLLKNAMQKSAGVELLDRWLCQVMKHGSRVSVDERGIGAEAERLRDGAESVRSCYQLLDTLRHTSTHLPAHRVPPKSDSHLLRSLNRGDRK